MSECQEHRFQHTAARRRLLFTINQRRRNFKFQHTAARRRLPSDNLSRLSSWSCFNTQPPEGGCYQERVKRVIVQLFQHTAARRRLLPAIRPATSRSEFQHTAARRRLPLMDDVNAKVSKFQHTAARRRLPQVWGLCVFVKAWFQHTAARRRLQR